jgi:hypothetical protein
VLSCLARTGCDRLPVKHVAVPQINEHLMEIETLGIRVTDDGFTVVDAAAKRVRCATQWKDLPAFEDLLISRLKGAPS